MRSRKGRSWMGRFTASTATPRRWSIRQGMPNPTAPTAPSTDSWTSRTVSTTISTSSAWSVPREKRWARWCTWSSESTAPANSFVPPRSTPITHSRATSATIPAPWRTTRSGPSGLRTRIYRARPRLLSRRDGTLDQLPSVPRGPAEPGRRGWRERVTVKRVLIWLAVAIVSWVGLSIVLFLAQRPDRARQGLRLRAQRAGRRRLPAVEREHDPGAGLRPPHQGHARAGGVHQRPEPLGLDHAHARGRWAQRPAVDPPRHGGRHPRPRPRQDQRRLRHRRPGARHHHRQAVPRDQDQPPHRGELRQLPEVHRLAGRDRLPGRLRDLAHQRRLSQRRLHPAPAAGHAPPQRQAGPGAGADAQEPLQPARGRPHPRPPPAANRLGDQGPAHLAHHVLPAAVGLVGGAQGDPQRHGGTDPARGLRQRGASGARPRLAS